MPKFIPRKKKNFAKKRKTFKKKKMPLYNSVKMGLGFPKKMIMKHRYNEVLSLQSTSGILQNYVFTANGIFDPNITGTGHQSMYLDTNFTLYNHAYVIASKITVRAVPTSTAQPCLAISLHLNDDTSVNASLISNIFENSTSKRPVIVPTGGGIGPFILTSKYSAKKVFGGSILGNSLLQNTVSANPTEQQYFILSLQAMDLVSSVALYFDVQIESIVVWNELKDLTSS